MLKPLNNRNPQIVIGLGTGRSGTVSLGQLLNAQPGAGVTHERRPLLNWNVDQAALEVRRRQLSESEATLVGDVGYYYLPYVQKLTHQFQNAKFVCMRRDRDLVIASMLRKTGTDNLWADHDGSEWSLNPVWDLTMPSYGQMPKADAIGRYWDEYDRIARRWEAAIPERFRIFNLENTLNCEAGVHSLLDFVGISREHQNVVTTIRANASP